MREKQHNLALNNYRIINTENSWKHGGDVIADTKHCTTRTVLREGQTQMILNNYVIFHILLLRKSVSHSFY